MLEIGTGKEPLQFPDGLGLYGFGPMGGCGLNMPVGSREHDTLEARALFIKDTTQKLLVISLDMPSGSRVLHLALLEKLRAAGHAFADGELMVVGTHTHSAPGQYFGNLYDLFGQQPAAYGGIFPLGYRKSVANHVVATAFKAAQKALAHTTPCHSAVTQRYLWGAGRNRSLKPFVSNFHQLDWQQWRNEFGPNGKPPATISAPEEVAVDPRLTIIAFVEPNGKPVATWATWCCHAAALTPSPLRPYHRDWPGAAVDFIEQQVPGVFAIVHQAANGDVTALPSGERRVADGLELVEEIGTKVGSEWVVGFNDAAAHASDQRFELGFRTFAATEENLPKFEIGASVIVGSEEIDPGFIVKAFGEGRTCSWRGAPQKPKSPALGPLQWLLSMLPALRVSARHPMWLVRIGAHVFFASPFEQTTFAARSIEKELTSEWRHDRNETITASPIGLVGDYAGYVTTHSEYVHQNYEGGHTLYGVNLLKELQRMWTAMIGTKLDASSNPAVLPAETKLIARAKALV